VIVSPAFAMNGTYSVTLTVVGPGGRHSTSVTVNVGGSCNPTARIVVATNNPQPGSPVVFNGAQSTGCNNATITNYTWDFGDGATESGDASKAQATHTYAAQGIYTVTLDVKDANNGSGRATRSLGVGVMVGKPTVTCPASATATAGVAASFTASGTDPGGQAMSYAWTFSDGGSGTGVTVQHTFAAAGSFTAQVVATTTDARTSDPCTVNVTVTAPVNFTGSWLLNPASGTLTGCTRYSVGFPATTLAVTHTGNSVSVVPSGNGYPASQTLTGTEEPPPASPGTFIARGTLPDENKSTCGTETRQDSVTLSFNGSNNPPTVQGTWRIVYTSTPACTMASCLPCDCVAQGQFSGIKQ
jgi:PKD repeat protein